MLNKQKICSGCNKTRFIFKTVGRDRYCASCSHKLFPPQKSEKKPKPIKQRSEKRVKEEKEYSRERIIFLESHSLCEAGLSCCTGMATECHHKAGRGKEYLNKELWLAVCHACHEWITIHSREAIEMGLSRSRLK